MPSRTLLPYQNHNVTRGWTLPDMTFVGAGNLLNPPSRIQLARNPAGSEDRTANTKPPPGIYTGSISRALGAHAIFY